MARKWNQDGGLFERPKDSDVWWIRYVGPDRGEHRECGGTKTGARALLARRRIRPESAALARLDAAIGQRRPEAQQAVTHPNLVLPDLNPPKAGAILVPIPGWNSVKSSEKQ
jgi:hypothetical protein